jgi:hypothetical protein
VTTFKKLASFNNIVVAGACTALLSGCGDREIKAYDVPKEQARASVPAMAETTEDGAPVTYKKPSGWKQLEPGNMRFASFSAPSKNGALDISITPIPGTAGSMLANVNRWRGQLELPEIAEAELKGDALMVAGEKVVVYDLVSTKNLSGEFHKRTLAAAVSHDGMQWFFKMTGDEAGVGEQKDTFVQFLGTVRFHEHGEVTQQQTSAPAPVAVTPSTATTEKEALSSGTPAGWKAMPPGQMLLAQYAITGPSGTTAKVTVSSFPGDVGGLAANVNRWRAQVGLAAQSAEDIEKAVTHFKVGSTTATLLDVEGKNPDGKPARLMAAIIPRDGNSVFYKLIGDVAAVAQEKDKFIKFVESSR